MRILGTNHCGEMRRTTFKRRELFQDVLCRRDYAERVLAIFSDQIQSEYYGRKSTFQSSTTGRYQFIYTVISTACSISLFLSENTKQDASTLTAHSKGLISLLKNQQILTTSLSTI